MKVLLTGAAGFIGFHLVQRLLENGHIVIGLDNINDYYDPALKFARLEVSGIPKESIITGNIVQSSKNDNYSFVREDIENKTFLLTLFESQNFDIVVNLAAQAGVRYSITNPDVYVGSNVQGFFNILDACRHYPVKHLVYASSSSVYGMNTKMPFSTGDNVDHPVSLYAASKRANELMAHTYSHLFGVPTTGLRFFTVYGPWGRPDMAYFLFVDAILNGKPIKVFNNGVMRRDFTYIDDIVEGLLRVIDKAPTAQKNDAGAVSAPYKLYNIGNSSPISLMHFIETIESLLNKEAIKEFLPMQPGDVPETWADVDDLMNDVGYKPATKVEKGVKEFISWYKGFYLS